MEVLNRNVLIIMTTAVILCLLTLLGANAATAQDDLIKSEYSYRRYSVNDGLPENYCWDVFQDSKGYIWTATSNGFARYDGQHFKVYWNERQTNVQNVTENREGNITALSFTYYAVLDPVADTLKLINHPEWRLITYSSQYMPTGYFFYKSADSDRKSLFQLSDTGLIKIWEHECLKDIDELRKPYWDKKNRIFYIPAKKYVYIVSEDNNTIRDSIAHQSILTVFPYNNTVGALGTDGIYHLENRKFKRIFEKKLIPNPSGLQAITDSENRLVIRDVTDIYRFDNKYLEHISNNVAFFNIFFDRENNLWTSSYEGLFNLFNLQFRNYTFKDANTIARSLYPDNDKVWIATYNGFLYQIKNDIIKEEKTPRTPDSYFQGKASKVGNHLFFPGGYINGDVLYFDGKKGVWLNLPNMDYYYTLPLDGNTVLFGSNQSIIIYDFTVGKIIRQLPRNALYLQPNCATVDKNGRILIGGSGGITIIEGDSIRLLDRPTDFAACRTITTDKTGKVWAASANKLFTVEGDSIKHQYTFDHLVRGMIITRNDVMIVLTLKGINIKEPGDKEFLYYDKNNGFTGEKIQMSQPIEDADGNIWILSDKTFVRFNPNALLQNQPVPTLYIRQIMTSTDNINWINTKKDENMFGYSNNNIKFQYIGINYSAIENVRYHYRLKGFQNEWSEPTKNREVTFNNLPPGDYVFEIYADAGTDDSRSETQSFAFTIKPAFWQTWWFIAISIMSLMLITAIAAIYYQRRKNAELLQRLSMEKQLNELRIKSIRLKAIPHFNANVLSAIEYYIMNRPKEEANRLLGIYSNFTYQTLREVDKASRSLQEELDYVQMYLQLEKLRFTDKFDYNIEIDQSINKEVQLPNMVLHTYCENAIKHAFATFKSGGTLKITAKQENNTVHIAVEDNGIGRRAAQSNTQVRSTKQGLDILNRQIEIYNSFNKQKIVQRVVDLVNDGIACGTRFILEVPLGFVYK